MIASMGQFYVFHATSVHHARVHKGDCPYCRNGQGMESQDQNGSGATGWDGPFATLQEAETKMATFKLKDAGKCNYCLDT